MQMKSKYYWKYVFISEILHGKRSITVSISLRLGKFFELNPSFWIGLQNDYDLRAEENKLKKEIKSIKSYKNIINKKLKSKAVAWLDIFNSTSPWPLAAPRPSIWDGKMSLLGDRNGLCIWEFE